MTRRRLLATGAGLAAAGAAAGAYAAWIEPTWVQVVSQDLPVPNLPPAWEGLRVVHIADLHHGRSVPLEYLARCMQRVADLKPDLLAVTGDFVSDADPRFGAAVAGLFAGLAPPLGIFACVGNHDYGIVRPTPPELARLRSVARDLESAGVRVLRNEAVRLARGGENLWIAGTDDLWAGRSDPQRAMRDIPQGAANLILCHNPDAAEHLSAAGCGTALAGHTHGGQIQAPLIGPLLLPVRHRERYQGLHQIGGTWLYINRGLGWLWRVRFACRPEISIHTLQSCAAGAETRRAELT